MKNVEGKIVVAIKPKLCLDGRRIGVGAMLRVYRDTFSSNNTLFGFVEDGENCLLAFIDEVEIIGEEE